MHFSRDRYLQGRLLIFRRCCTAPPLSLKATAPPTNILSIAGGDASCNGDLRTSTVHECSTEKELRLHFVCNCKPQPLDLTSNPKHACAVEM